MSAGGKLTTVARKFEQVTYPLWASVSSFSNVDNGTNVNLHHKVDMTIEEVNKCKCLKQYPANIFRTQWKI